MDAVINKLTDTSVQPTAKQTDQEHKERKRVEPDKNTQKILSSTQKAKKLSSPKHNSPDKKRGKLW